MAEYGISNVITTYHRIMSKVTLEHVRYLYDEINWEARLIAIKGPRGTGKTTLMLQRIKKAFANIDDALYISLDSLYFKTNTLTDIVDYAYTHGIMHIFIDEIHRYDDWGTELKYIYDSYPDLYIIYSGSSLLKIDNSTADLSRRQTVYNLEGLSFREFLAFEKVIDIPPISIEDLLKKHTDIALKITSELKILPLFEKYVKCGYYPFYKEAKKDYLSRLSQAVSVIIDIDLPATENISYATMNKTKKLLMVIAQRCPFVPNISQLFIELDIARDLGMKMLYALERAKLINLLTDEIKSYKHLTKPQKIFLNNTNLSYALAERIDIGNQRETFFLNQTSISHSVLMPQKGDFFIDGKYLFEVGGKNKTFDQIADVANSFLAIDGIETGHKNRIPLWMFGLMY